MSDLCPAGKVAGRVEAERLEAEAVSGIANMLPKALPCCLQGLGTPEVESTKVPPDINVVRDWKLLIAAPD
jgi:hypothetical protein